MKTYHILNGDSLSEIFAKEISGQKIIMRECLIVGKVQSENLDDFFRIRAEYLHKTYNLDKKKYAHLTVNELQKLNQISSEDNLYFWFEEDVFCQLNFWFLCKFIQDKAIKQAFLVLPSSKNKYNFTAETEEDLVSNFKNALEIPSSELKIFAKMWDKFTENNILELEKISLKLHSKFTYLNESIKAISELNTKPKEVLINILSENPNYHFQEIFQIFKNQMQIYGFGDMQVKQILKEIRNQKNTKI